MSNSIDRIVVINDYTVPVGGAGMLAMQSVRAYRARGFAVSVLTGQEATPELNEVGADVVGLGAQGLLKIGRLKGLQQGYHNGDAAQMVADWIAENDTPGTVYHLHNWSQILSPAVFTALQPVAARTVVTCHDFFNVCPNGSFIHYDKQEICDKRPLSGACLVSQCDRRSSLHKYWRIARQYHLKNVADFASAPYTFTLIHAKMKARFLEAGFPARDLVVVSNPVAPWSQTRIAAEANDNFLFVGRIGPDKGTDIALEATKAAGVPLTVIGSGDDEVALAQAYPHAHFVGWCDRAQILEHVRSARALIVPSRVVEPFGLVLLEAAMSGVPVLASDRAYLADDMQDGGMGITIDVNEASALAALVGDLARDDARIEAMSRAGHAGASALGHTPESWIDDFLALFERKLEVAA